MTTKPDVPVKYGIRYARFKNNFTPWTFVDSLSQCNFLEAIYRNDGCIVETCELRPVQPTTRPATDELIEEAAKAIYCAASSYREQMGLPRVASWEETTEEVRAQYRNMARAAAKLFSMPATPPAPEQPKLSETAPGSKLTYYQVRLQWPSGNWDEWVSFTTPEKRDVYADRMHSAWGHAYEKRELVIHLAHGAMLHRLDAQARMRITQQGDNTTRIEDKLTGASVEWVAFDPIDDGLPYTTGHCPEGKKPGGCQLHNLQCGYPGCDRRSKSK